MHANKSLNPLISILASVLTVTYSLICEAQQKVYWTDNSSGSPAIRCVDTSGAGCLTNPSDTLLLSLDPSDSPGGIVVDEKNERLIFVNSLNPGKIESCKLDGTDRKTLLTLTDTPLHLAIDQVRDKIYWGSFSGVYTAGTDGGTPLYLDNLTGSSFTGVTVASDAASLFVVKGPPDNTIYEADLSVANITFNAIRTFGTSTENIFGLALDETNQTFYFTKSGTNVADLTSYTTYSTGGTQTDVLSLNNTSYYAYGPIAVDYPEGNVYYGNFVDQKIYKTSLSSPTQTSFITLPTASIQGITLSCGKYAKDSDGDSLADCRENCDTDPLKTEPGLCGCNTTDTDMDKDGTPDCNDQCEDDENKTEPGECGCGAEEPIGECDCGLIEDINVDGKVVCVKSRQLAPNTKIENPPEVEVDGDDVTFTLEKFTKPTLTLKKKKKAKTSAFAEFYSYEFEAKGNGLKVKYEIQVSKVGGTKRDLQKLTSKKNELTVKDLAPGNYNVKYRAIITQNGKDAAKTGFSPSATFTIG